MISVFGVLIGAQAFISYVPWHRPPAWVPHFQLACGILCLVIGALIAVKALFQADGGDRGLALFTVVWDVLLLVLVLLNFCGMIR